MEQQKNVKRTSSQVLELQQLIAAPLVSTIEADALSAQKYLDFLMKFAFESFDPVTGRTGQLRLITFAYTEQGADGKTHRREASIPLLTLIPLPLLHVEEADFDFDIKIIDALTEKAEETFSYEDEFDVRNHGLGIAYGPFHSGSVLDEVELELPMLVQRVGELCLVSFDDEEAVFVRQRAYFGYRSGHSAVGVFAKLSNNIYL